MARRLAAAVVVLAMLVIAAPAQGASGTFTCAQLQTALNNVQDGDVITLNGTCNQGYALPNFATPDSGMGAPDSYINWTLEGSAGAGFDGTGIVDRALTGTDVHNLEIRNLVFRDFDIQGNGGAISVDGESSLVIRTSSFFNNHASNEGGAVYIAPITALAAGETLRSIVMDTNTFGSESVPAEGNSAGTGGALAVDTPGQGQNSSYHDNSFFNNTAEDDGGAFTWVLDPASSTGENFALFGNVVKGNTAAGDGGGGYVVHHGAIRVSGERYESNTIDPASGSPVSDDHFGGGLYVSHSGSTDQDHNVFRSNSIQADADGGDYGGGGVAWTGGLLVTDSRYGRYESNSLPAADSGHESEGGGLFSEAAISSWYGLLEAYAGNTIGAGGHGGGIYVGITGPPPGTQLMLAESTVAGNSVGGGSGSAGIAGDPDDRLTLRNSIVWNGPAGGDITGFSVVDASYTDACDGGTTEADTFEGEGNICKDPKLAGGANVHQTTLSPTIDAGSDALFETEGGERNPEDYEGDPRPTDGNGDGHTVDMGADESPAFVAQQPPPPPPHVPQCSDGADNDGDGAIDAADPGCLAGPADDNEGDETPGDLVLCGSRDISLVRADVKGSKVRLSGFVATKFAGQKVTLSVRYLKRAGKAEKLGTVTAAADGSFKRSVKGPKRKAFTFARYRAQVGTAKSVELKLPQSLASSSLKRVAGGMLELRGQVDRTLLGKRNAVVVKRILCGKYSTVGQAKPDRKGKYVVRFPAPASGGSALYRAETKVLARPGSKRYVKQFARAIGITF